MLDYNMLSRSYDDQYLILALPWSDLGHNQWDWTYPAWTPENYHQSPSSHKLQSKSNALKSLHIFVHLKDGTWFRFKLLLNLKELFSSSSHLGRKEAKARHRHHRRRLFWHFWHHQLQLRHRQPLLRHHQIQLQQLLRHPPYLSGTGTSFSKEQVSASSVFLSELYNCPTSELFYERNSL